MQCGVVFWRSQCGHLPINKKNSRGRAGSDTAAEAGPEPHCGKRPPAHASAAPSRAGGRAGPPGPGRDTGRQWTHPGGMRPRSPWSRTSPAPAPTRRLSGACASDRGPPAAGLRRLDGSATVTVRLRLRLRLGARSTGALSLGVAGPPVKSSGSESRTPGHLDSCHIPYRISCTISY